MYIEGKVLGSQCCCRELKPGTWCCALEWAVSDVLKDHGPVPSPSVVKHSQHCHIPEDLKGIWLRLLGTRLHDIVQRSWRQPSLLKYWSLFTNPHSLILWWGVCVTFIVKCWQHSAIIHFSSWDLQCVDLYILGEEWLERKDRIYTEYKTGIRTGLLRLAVCSSKSKCCIIFH